MSQGHDSTSNATKPRRKICCGCLREFDDNLEFCPVDKGHLTPLYFDNPQLATELGDSIKVKSVIADSRSTRILLCDGNQGRQHALRLLKRTEQRYVSAFLQEGQLLAQLSHDRIIRLYAAGTLGREPYMMLEYIPGGNLDKWLKESEKLRFADVARIVMQVCEGLLYLHERNVSYPILKPGHIVFRDQLRQELCLIDLSKTFFAHDHRNVSIGGAIFLNPHFSAPEVLMGREPTIASSAYSISCLIFRCLTGKNLFGGQTDLQLASQHMSSTPPVTKWSEYGVPKDFEQLIVGGLKKASAERTTVQQFFDVAKKYVH